MKTSITWLRDYTDIPFTPKELASRLTAAGLEVEGIETMGAIPDGVITAKILSRAKHENSDHLSVCQVSTGDDSAPLQIVCGAPNCDAGSIVPLATIGTDFGDGFVIKKSKLRGVESNGMMCSERELGLSNDHNGLMILPQDTPLGVPLGSLIQSDTVIDWEVTPNRPDWLCHIGIAREAAAATGKPLNYPKANIAIAAGTSIHDFVKVSVTAPDLCPRYIARVFRNVKVGPSPEWMVKRLQAVGLRSINNVVDITNFVMLEYGQPLHAFDLTTLAGREIIVRRAENGEEITTLDGEKLTLSPDNLLIADHDRGVALAGVMGGENSMITDATTTVMLEAATFNPGNIRSTSRTKGKSTDSSYRYERGVSPEVTALASARAAALLCELAGAEQIDGVIDCYPQPWQAETIACSAAKINALLGLNLSADDIAGCLKRRAIPVISVKGDSVTVSTPWWRTDLHTPTDIAEEVAQMTGLDAIPENTPVAKLGGSITADKYLPTETLRAELLSLGFNEIVNYTLYSLNECLAGTPLNEADILKVSNPISSDTAYLRPTILPGLLKVVAHNVARNQHNIRIFEIGRVFRQTTEGPKEFNQAGLAVSGLTHPERFGAERSEQADFFSMKGSIASWLEMRGFSKYRFETADHPAFKNGACGVFVVGGKPIVHIGQANDKLTAGFRLRYPLFLALIDMDALATVQKPTVKYKELPQFPGTSRDITFVAPLELTHQNIVDAIMGMKLPLLKRVELFDIFENEKALGSGRRSLSYSLYFEDPQRTLTDDEVNKLQEKVRNHLATKLNVELK